MRRIYFLQVLFIATVLFACHPAAEVQSANGEWSEKSAARWFRQKDWANGLMLAPHSSIDKVTFAEMYHKNQANWDKAFAWLKSTNLDTLSAGKYPIDGDKVYATITIGPPKEFEQTKWESHRHYTDLQYVVKGKEKIGVAPLSTTTVTSPYNESTDLANYTADGKYYIAEPGTFFLFFPQQAHRPGNHVPGYDYVKKLVIKVRND